MNATVLPPAAGASEVPPAIELVLITGMSGSGKSIALTALEDLGFYCVDNLPPELLVPFIALEQSHRASKVAIAMDVRSAASLPGLPDRLEQIKNQAGQDVHLRTVFLDATTDTLVRRFSETRRLHPLSMRDSQDQRRALIEAIEGPGFLEAASQNAIDVLRLMRASCGDSIYMVAVPEAVGVAMTISLPCRNKVRASS